MIENYQEDKKTLAEVHGKIWTNGKCTDGRTLYLGDNLNADDFYLITEEEYEAIIAAEEAEKQNNI